MKALKYILILILFTSCSSAFMVNGTPIKQKTKTVGKKEKSAFILTVITWATMANYLAYKQ